MAGFDDDEAMTTVEFCNYDENDSFAITPPLHCYYAMTTSLYNAIYYN